MLNSTRGGTKETELNELMVVPRNWPSAFVVTIATPVAKWPKAFLNSQGSNCVIVVGHDRRC